VNKTRVILPVKKQRNIKTMGGECLPLILL